MAAQSADASLEGDLSKRGLDAYQPAYAGYTFCAICEPEDGWVTLLSESLWPSEVIRRVRPAVQPFDIYIARPNLMSLWPRPTFIVRHATGCLIASFLRARTGLVY